MIFPRNHDDDYDDLEEFEEQGQGCLAPLAKGVLGVILFLAVALVLLPVLLSTDTARNLVLQKVNHAIAPDQVVINRWSISWFSPLKLERLAYESHTGGVSLYADEVVMSHGLWGVIPVGRLNPGVVTLKTPRVQLMAVQPPPPLTGDTLPPSPKKSKGVFLPIIDLALRLIIENGSLEIHDNQTSQIVASRMTGELHLASWRKPIGADLRMAIGGGTAVISGQLQSIRDFVQPCEPKTTPEQLSLRLNRVELASLTPLMTLFGVQPMVDQGVAEGSIRLDQMGHNHYAVECGVIVSKLSLIGAESMRNKNRELTLFLAFEYHEGGMDISKLDISSPWVSAASSGKINMPGKAGNPHTGILKAELESDLVAVAEDFATYLGLSPDFKLEKGKLKASLLVSGSDTECGVDFDAATTGLRLRVADAVMTFSPEPTLRCKLRLPYGKWPEIDDLRFKAPFADIFAKGSFDNAVAKGTFDLTMLSRDLKRMTKAWPPMVGKLYLDGTTRSSATATDLTLFVKCSDSALEIKPGRLAVVPQGSFKLSATAPLVNNIPVRELHNASFHLDLSHSNIEGGWKRLTLPESGPPLLSGFSLKSNLDIVGLFQSVGWLLPISFSEAAELWEGRFLANITAEAAGGSFKAKANAAGVQLRSQGAYGEWSLPDLRLAMVAEQGGEDQILALDATLQGSGTLTQQGRAVFTEPAFDANLKLRLADQGNSLQIPTLQINSEMLKCSAAASLTELDTRCFLNSEGTLTLNCESLNYLLNTSEAGHITITGSQPRKFKFAGPLAGGLPTLMREAEFNGGVFVESLRGMGIHTSPADLSLTLKQGILRSSYTPRMNGGQLSFVPEINTLAPEVCMTLPQHTRVLHNINLNQTMMDQILAQANPLFQGSKLKKGTMSLELQHFAFTPNAPADQQINTELTLTFNQLEMVMGPTLLEVLSILRIKERSYTAAHLPVRLKINQGYIHLLPLEIVVDQQPVIISGWLRFDGTIKYMIEIPVTERLAGPAAKMFRNTTIKIPVTGHVDNPRLDTGELKKAMTNILKKVISQETLEKIGGFLERVQQELQR